MYAYRDPAPEYRLITRDYLSDAIRPMFHTDSGTTAHGDGIDALGRVSCSETQ